jgi:hypothetical protein
LHQSSSNATELFEISPDADPHSLTCIKVATLLGLSRQVRLAAAGRQRCLPPSLRTWDEQLGAARSALNGALLAALFSWSGQMHPVEGGNPKAHPETVIHLVEDPV